MLTRIVTWMVLSYPSPSTLVSSMSSSAVEGIPPSERRHTLGVLSESTTNRMGGYNHTLCSSSKTQVSRYHRVSDAWYAYRYNPIVSVSAVVLVTSCQRLVALSGCVILVVTLEWSSLFTVLAVSSILIVLLLLSQFSLLKVGYSDVLLPTVTLLQVLLLLLGLRSR